MKTPAEPGAAPTHPIINLPTLRHQIEQKGISYRMIARRVHVDRAHLKRVLSGERSGSQALLCSIAEIVEGVPDIRPQDQVTRLIAAAVHVFFLKRGRFESEVCRPPLLHRRSLKKGGRP